MIIDQKGIDWFKYKSEALGLLEASEIITAYRSKAIADGNNDINSVITKALVCIDGKVKELKKQADLVDV